MTLLANELRKEGTRFAGLVGVGLQKLIPEFLRDQPELRPCLAPDTMVHVGGQPSADDQHPDREGRCDCGSQACPEGTQTHQC